MAGPLDGLRVLDLTRMMSGPFCSVMLADLGAEVTKVEIPGLGDLFRHMGGYNRNGTNAMFMGLNRGKRSIALDLSTSHGVEIARRLAKQSDVFVENFRPGVAARLGLGADVLHADNPQLIIASITGFGTTGPSAQEPAYDTIVQGRSAIASRQRSGPDAEPDVVRSFIGDKLGGIMAAQSILAALVARSRGASGQNVEISMLNASIYYGWSDVMQEIAFIGPDVNAGKIFAYQRFVTPTSDGYVVHFAVSIDERHRLAKAVGREDLNDDARFATLEQAVKLENWDGFGDEIARALCTMSTEEAVARLRDADVPVAAVVEPQDLLQDPHLAATGFFVEAEHATAGVVRQPSYPAVFSRTAPVPVGAAPTVGQHTSELLRDAGYDEAEIAELFDARVVA